MKLPGVGVLELPVSVATRLAAAVGEAAGTLLNGTGNGTPTVDGVGAGTDADRHGGARRSAGGLVGELGHAVAGGADQVRTIVHDGVELVEDAFGDHRRVWEEHGRAEIEVRAVGGPRAGDLRRRLKKSLEQLHGVEWAEVNGITNRVAIAFDPSATPLSSVVSVVEAAERAYGASRRRQEPEADPRWDCPDRADHPADIEPIHQAVAALVGDGLGLGISVATRLVRVPALPIELAGLVSLIDNQPHVRRHVEARIGRRAADLVLPLATAAANSAGQGPSGILLDMAYRVSALSELRARRAVWVQREAQFYATPRHKTVKPPRIEPRPVPLPRGPVEEWSDRVSAGALVGFAGTLLASGDPRRAADTFLAGIPKAARLGREGFATQFGRVLAARGVVPLDASALRRLDRVDTVVLDAATLLNGQHEVLRVVPVGDHPEEELARRADELFDPDDVDSEHCADGWSLRPFVPPRAVSGDEASPAGADVGNGGEPVEAGDSDAGTSPADGSDRSGSAGEGTQAGGLLAIPRGAIARARELRRAGAVPLALVHQGRIEALVGAVPQLDPGAEVLVASVRQAGHRLVVAGRVGAVAERVGADGRVRAGRRMGVAIRALQAEGAVVAAVARKRNSGLAAADVGINLQRRSGRPSWGADLLCGSDLTEAALIIDATVVAAAVSRRSGQLAAAGSTVGAVVALTGPVRTAASRGMLVVNGAGAAALAAGAWSGAALGRRPRPRVRRHPAWHVMTADEVLDRLDSEAEGLTSWEADRRRRRVQDADVPSGGVVQPLLAELANPLTPVLAAGAGLSAVAGSAVDAGLVAGLIGVNTVVGGLQRIHAERAVSALLRTSANQARARRDGVEVLVDEDDLVPGDVISLRAGDAVPADCRILDAVSLEVDESTLTGESLPVAKSAEPCPGREVAERACLLYQDTTIAAGEATAVVVAVGDDTEVGASIAAVASAPVTGGVEARLEQLTRRIVPASALAGAGVVATGLLRRWPMSDVVGSAVSMAVAAVPEGLPFLASAAQLAAARRLAARNAVVRNPRTIEALGRVDVLCFDKTGTLTEGHIELRCISDGAGERSLDDPDDATLDVLAAALRATPPDPERADMTDAAVLAGAARHGVEARRGLAAWEVVNDLPFEASRGLYAVLGRCADGNRLSVKGAPEVVLPACSSWRRGNTAEPFDRAAMAEVAEHVERLAGRGYRVLAVAERVASDRAELDPERVNDLELRGLIGLTDPVRPSAASAVASVRAAGVETVMITGDHPSTAEAVAAELDMMRGRRVVTGAELDRLDDDQLEALLGEVAVFARVTPNHKLRIVGAFQRAGRTVAMTGDGSNDAAAIRLAHVGVALGERGTAAARDAADVVVTDDRIETIIDAIVEGRALWGSVREALAILVGGNLGEIAFTVAASLLSRRAPITTRQLLLVNLVTDLAPAVAIATRPPADTSVEVLLREGPEASLGTALSRDIAIRAVTTAGGAGAAWLAARATGTAGRAGTVALVALVGTQMGQTVLAGRGRSPVVVAVGIGSLVALVAIVQTPGVSQFFGCRPLGPLGWAQAFTAATAATAVSAAASHALAAAAAAGRAPALVPADRL